MSAGMLLHGARHSQRSALTDLLCDILLPKRSLISAAQTTDRRATVAMLGGIAALLQVNPSHAAFGQGANIFGKVGNTSGLIPYSGKGFKVDLPSKWTPSAERDVPNVVLR